MTQAQSNNQTTGAVRRPLSSYIGWLIALILGCVIGVQQCSSYVEKHPYQAPTGLGPTSIERDCFVLNVWCNYQLSMNKVQYYILTGEIVDGEVLTQKFGNEKTAISTGQMLDRAVNGFPVTPVTQATAPAATMTRVLLVDPEPPVAKKPAVKKPVAKKKPAVDDEKDKLYDEVERLRRELANKPAQQPVKPAAPMVITNETVRTIEIQIPPECQGSVYAKVEVPKGYKITAFQSKTELGGFLELPPQFQGAKQQLNCLFPKKGDVLFGIKVIEVATGKAFWVVSEDSPHVVDGQVKGYNPTIEVKLTWQGGGSRVLSFADTKYSPQNGMPVFNLTK